MNEVSALLLDWHRTINRDLPWKDTSDPYFIWASEIILQQTRVEQGRPYYYRFVEKFPTIQLLAEASQEELFKVWEGLGYYSRARNMHATAKHIVYNLDGEFPSSYDELIKLKGVGPYTAAAVASFAFNEDKAVLDGNVFRIISRLYNEDSFINEAKNRKLFQSLVDDLLPTGKSAKFNQAIMDFGSRQCKPKNPSCETCVLNELCAAYRAGTVHDLPKKRKTAKKKERYFYFLDLRPKHGPFPVVQRTRKDIWQGLFSLPFIDSNSPLSELSIEDWKEALALELDSLPYKTWETKHVLSHQNLHCSFYRIDHDSQLKEEKVEYEREKYQWKKDEDELAWPVVISKYFQKFER